MKASLVLLGGLLLGAASGCREDEVSPDDSSMGGAAGAASQGSVEVRLDFEGRVGDEPFACASTFADVGSTPTTVVPQDFRFYVSNVALLDARGRETPLTLAERAPFQGEGVALLDFEDGEGDCSRGNPATNSFVTAAIESGDYVGIAFDLGVPEELNHESPLGLPAPLQAGGMHWGWLFGFKFLRLEFEDALGEGSYLFHLGAVGCDNREYGQGGAGGATERPNHNAPPTVACARPNRPRIVLPDFRPERDVIVVDARAALDASDVTDIVTCHPKGDACIPSFASVGIDYETGAPLDSAPLFRVERR